MTSCSQGRVTTAKDFATMPGTILDQFYIFFSKIIRKRIFFRAFNCRSYAQKGDRCYLSGDDSVTLQGVPQPVDIGAVYKEKACTRSK